MTRQLAVFRHAHTKKGAKRGLGSHLSSEGVAIARRVGATLGPFARVIASPEPRTLETAVAMGFAVDDVADVECKYVPGEFDHHAQWEWDQPFARLASLIGSGGKLANLAHRDRTRWLRWASETADDGRVLVVSHGGSIEPVLVACLPDADHRTWGQPFSHCDGAILTVREGAFVEVEFRRALGSA
jgi:broad specificity phosphatase PhoE